MDNKTLIVGGIATLALILGMTSFTLRRQPSADSIPLDAEATEVLGEESLVEFDGMENLTKDIKQYDAPPEMQLKDGVNYKAVIKTNMGDMTIDLFETDSPQTVNNFVFLARDGFYDGVVFHRIIEEFMIQGGDPLGLGSGGPGYQFEDEINDNKIVRGSLAMANAGPNTNGSQFFIVTAPETPHLDGLHTNFGQLVEGEDILAKIAKTPVETNIYGEASVPAIPVTIDTVEIIEE